MAHIICITSGLRGILYASFGMLRQLEQRGHQITYACPKEVGDIVTANGFPYLQLPPTNFFPAPDLPAFSSKWKRLLYKFRYAKRLQKQAVTNLGMDVFGEKIDELNPDLLLIDVELHEHLMTAIAKNRPTILLSQWFSLWNRKGLPPLLEDTIPGKGWRGSELGIRWAWWKIQVQRKLIFLKTKIRTGGTNRRSVLRLYAKSIGFPVKYIKENYWPGPFTYSELPVLSMTLEELEFPHDKRPNLYYVGLMIDTQRVELQQDKQVESQLKNIYKKVENNQKSLIYCSVSSFKKGDESFIRRLINAIEGQKDWILVLSLGGLLEKNNFKDLPTNVFAFSWIPQIQVLANANCSINHGGIHTINECVHFQVPMLIYSGKRSDQNGCAARVAYHGLGIMADKDVDDSQTIQIKIKEILETVSYKENLQEMHQHYKRYKEEKILQKQIEEFINGK